MTTETNNQVQAIISNLTHDLDTQASALLSIWKALDTAAKRHPDTDLQGLAHLVDLSSRNLQALTHEHVAELQELLLPEDEVQPAQTTGTAQEVTELFDQGTALRAVQVALKDQAHEHNSEALHGLAALVSNSSDRIFGAAERLQAAAG